MQDTHLLLVELLCGVVLVSSGCGWFILLACEFGARQYYSQRKRHVSQKVMVRHTLPASLPPNFARFIYATEGTLFISAQLSSDAVSALRKVWVLIWRQKRPSVKART